MKNYKAVIAVFALLLVAAFGLRAYAAQAQTTGIGISGLPQITITAAGQAVSVLATDPGTLASKRAQVVQFTDVDGRTFVVLVRAQKSPTGFYLDLVAEASIGELTTRVAAMTLTGASHPAPAADAVDTAVLAAAD